jgi:hypothetical protein
MGSRIVALARFSWGKSNTVAKLHNDRNWVNARRLAIEEGVGGKFAVFSLSGLRLAGLVEGNPLRVGV